MKLTAEQVKLLNELGKLLLTANSETDYTDNQLAEFGNAAADVTENIWNTLDNGTNSEYG